MPALEHLFDRAFEAARGAADDADANAVPVHGAGDGLGGDEDILGFAWSGEEGEALGVDRQEPLALLRGSAPRGTEALAGQGPHQAVEGELVEQLEQLEVVSLAHLEPRGDFASVQRTGLGGEQIGDLIATEVGASLGHGVSGLQR